MKISQRVDRGDRETVRQKEPYIKRIEIKIQAERER